VSFIMNSLLPSKIPVTLKFSLQFLEKISAMLQGSIHTPSATMLTSLCY
jgi:hypothetical protein